MGLKPDSWIRKMAVEQKMIEPFVENQVSRRRNFLWFGLHMAMIYGSQIEFKILPMCTAP